MASPDLEALADRIAEQVAHLDAATHRLLADLRAFDESGAWHTQGARSCASWLSWRVGWDMRTANEHMRVANRLGKLPRIDDALRRGEMSFAKVRAMVRVATPQNEEMLLEEARYSTGAQLEKICRQYARVRRHDDDVTPKDDEQRRYLTRHDTSDGMVRIEAVLHPEEAALVWAAIERVAVERCREREDARRDAGRREAVAVGGESSEQPMIDSSAGSAEPDKINSSAKVDTNAAKLPISRPYPKGFDRADALVVMSEHVLRGTSADRAPIDLVLTASVDALTRHACSGDGSHEGTLGSYIQSRTVEPRPTGWIHPSEMFDHITIDPRELGILGDGTAISATAARRLACDCGFTAVLESDHGTPITIGRKRRTIPASMKRALLRRDHTCRFPGCGARVFLQGHHVQHWMDGGKTELGNIVSLCSHHHRYVHEYGFRVELSCTGDVQFVGVDGRVLKGVPDPVVRENLGWPAILSANADLAISHETCACGWNGGPVDYHLCVDALIAADEGRIRYPI